MMRKRIAIGGFSVLLLVLIFGTRPTSSLRRSAEEGTKQGLAEPRSERVGNAVSSSAPTRHAAGGLSREIAEKIAVPIAAAARGDRAPYVMRDRNVSAFFAPGGKVALALATATRGWGLHWSPVGARPVEPEPQEQLPGRVNSFVGDPSTWKTDMPTYARLVYRDILPGVDEVVESRGHGIEYSFHAAPGADLTSLRLRYEGAEEVRVVDHGSALEVVTGMGTLREDGLHCYQGDAAIEARYEGLGGNEYTIRLGAYDPSLTLVIDPTISWSSFLGGAASGTASDTGSAIAVDSAGAVYVAGYTYSSDFPTTGGFDTSYGGSSDAFVAKINASGSAVVWSSYLGGRNSDYAYGIAVDGSGNVYVCGYTYSYDFPTPNGFKTAYGGSADAFVTKVNAAGSSLAWSSYLGGLGSGYDVAYAIAVDASGNAYVTGETSSSNFPTSGGFTTTYRGSTDAFVTKVNAAGSSLAWSSYLGGTSGDYGRGIAVDSSGNAYVTGNTSSSDFTLSSSFDSTFSGGQEAFVTKVNSSGTLGWSSFAGGASSETGRAIAVDSSGNVYITGDTSSSDFFGSSGYDTTYNGSTDAFVTKISTTPSVTWSTYLGGVSSDYGYGIAVDSSPNVYVTGYTNSNDFPMLSPFDSTFVGGQEAFVTKVNSSGTTLGWSSYLGGSSSDQGYAIKVDSSGNAYVTGSTSSSDFSVPSGFDTSFGSGSNAFVTKVNSAGSSLAWSSYLGGTTSGGDDQGYTMAIDSSGNVYLGGYTYSTDFPPAGGFDATFGGGMAIADAFVTKVTAAGSLVWSSYLGGTGTDIAYGIAVDSSGNVYVAGSTSSSDFTTTASAYDTVYNGGGDAFVTKVNAAGSSLAWSTFLGGTSFDIGYGIAVDATGSVYVTGETSSNNFPTVAGFNSTYAGGTEAFVTKLASTGTALTWSSYVGGIGSDTGRAIAVDGSGNVYLTGSTYSSDFPVWLAIDSSLGGSNDAFVAKVNGAGSSLAWSTYLGGSGGESAYGIAIDTSGNVYVTGYTSSSDFPTAGGFDATYGGNSDAFVTKIKSDGTARIWSSYLGDTEYDEARAVAVDESGNVYVTGHTHSPNFPSSGGFDTTYGGVGNDNGDAFVTKVDAVGSTLAWSSFLGGWDEDYGYCVSVDSSGNVYAAGYTSSFDFPTTGGFDKIFGAGTDAFVVKIAAYVAAATSSPNSSSEGGSTCGLIGLELLGPLALMWFWRRRKSLRRL